MRPRSSFLLRLCAVSALALTVPVARAVDVIEFYHQGLDHYFVTSSAGEIADLDTGVHAGWTRTGHKFQVFEAGDSRLAGSQPVCRFYGSPASGLNSHFYSATPQECIDVQVRFPDAWLLESSEVFRLHSPNPTTGVCPVNTKAVYRLYNQRPDVNHRYTTDLVVVDQMLARGYVLEGFGGPRPVVFCAADFNPPSAVPVCSIAPSSTTPAINTTLTLTASCTNGPTSYQWTNCTSATSSCTVSESMPGTSVYSVTARNAAGVSQVVSVFIDWQPAVSGPPVCSLFAIPANPYLGDTAIITANCSQSPTSFSWTGCSSASANTCRATRGQTGPASYSVVASNASGPGASASITLNWQTPPPPGSDLCGAYSRVMRIDTLWGGFVDTNDPGGGLEDDMVLAARIVVPSTATGTSIPGIISAVERVDAPVARVMSISRSACDFRGFTPGSLPPTDPTGMNYPIAWSFGNSPSVQFLLSTMAGPHAKLVPGQTYYVNIRHTELSTGANSCPGPECNVRVQVDPPR